MTLLDAPPKKSYILVAYQNLETIPEEFRRRGISLNSVFGLVGSVGSHLILKFGGMRIAIHRSVAKNIEVKEVIDEDRTGGQSK